MARLTSAEQADLTDLESIILNDTDFAALMEDEKQVEDILERSYLVETMEAAILAHDRRQAETEEKPTGLFTAFRESRKNHKATSKRKIGRKSTPKVAAPKKRKSRTVYSSKLVLNPNGTMGAIRNGKGGLVEGNSTSHAIGIESYKSANGGEPELIGRKMYTPTMIANIINLPADDFRRLKDVCAAK